MRFGTFLSLLLVVLLALANPVSSQTGSATLSGVVLDPNGAVVPDAQVEATNTDNGVVASTKTNDAGRYMFFNLLPGHYRLTVTKDGFKQIVQTGMVFNVQDVMERNFALQIGTATETVTVVGEAGRIETSPAVSTVIDRQFVANIPLNGRTLQSLVQLTPGVVATAPSFGDEGQFSVNGQRTDSNYYTVDGVGANAGVATILNLRQFGGSLPGFSSTGTTSNLVSVDAVQEFRIQTSTFAPEFGRTPGAQISIVTRSGTKDYHGSIFEYFRNDVLDAKEWFANANRLPKSKERQNDFGGVLGGPIVREKTFFFFSYEGARLRQPSTLESLVPDTASRTAAAGTAVAPLLALFPVPTKAQTPAQVAAGIAEADATVSNPSSLNATSLRIDHNLTKSWRLFARYNYAPSSASVQGGGSAGSSEPLNYVGASRSRTQTGTIGTTKTFGFRMANEFFFNYTRNNFFGTSTLTGFGGATVPTLAQLIPPSEGITIDPAAIGYELNVIGLGVADVGRTSANIQRQLNFVDNFSLNEKTHALKFGVDYRRLTPLSRPPTYLQLPVFCGVASCPFLPTTFLLSQTALEAVVVSDQTIPVLFNNYSLYVQDTWAVSRRLTLTYGARWEINPPPTGQNGVQLRTFVDPFATANLQLAPAGTPFYKTTYGNIAPRAGIAYSVRQAPGQETIVRGGFGIFYDLGNSDAADSATAFPYFRLGAQLFQPYPLPPSAVAPIPFSTNPPYGQIATTDPNLKLPRTYEWNASVEQALGGSQSLTFTYLGAVGRNLIRNVTLTPATAANGEFVVTNGATSDYHTLQVQFQRRLFAGLQALASYTFSHSIDTQSSNNGSNVAPASAFNPNLERGSSDFDVRHAFSGAVTYDIPGRNFGAFGNAILHDWAVDSILIARSATPVDVSATSSFGPGTSITRPNIVLGQPFYLSDPNAPGGVRLNPAAFSAPAKGTQGNLGRNALRGVGATQLDFAIRRQFHIYERWNLQFRAEFFNILNHPNFANFNGNFFSSKFGLSTQTLASSLGGTGGLSPIYQLGGPRSIQLALKLNF